MRNFNQSGQLLSQGRVWAEITTHHRYNTHIKVCKRSDVRPRQNFSSIQSVQFSHSVVFDSLQPHGLQHTRPPRPSPTPGAHSNSRLSSLWCHPAISSSVVPFSSCPKSLTASESFPMRQLFAWGGQSTGVSALASYPPKKSQGWSPSEWTGWISLQSKGLSRVFSNTTVQKHQLYLMCRCKYSKSLNRRVSVEWETTDCSEWRVSRNGEAMTRPLTCFSQNSLQSSHPARSWCDGSGRAVGFSHSVTCAGVFISSGMSVLG